ncbi:MAG: amino acid ABC transporter permease [Epsilonproteobacteria bacterium]|nr:MAG: amino acid ABC transporter permease [Campylobacterota bacterium]RLA67625.1 MAG: amino acid ABC transporter permease [Campylobacterota bacterium]
MKFWDDQKNREKVYQLLALLAVIGLGLFFYSNTKANLEKQNIATGFSFFDQVAGFEISESLIEYNSEDSYLQALVVGVLNTLKIAIIGNVLAVFLGIFIGVCRLSKNWPLAKLAQGYVEIIRNIPLLLQLFFWYAMFTEIFPGVRQALTPMPGVFLSNRGIMFPSLEYSPVYLYMGVAFFLTMIFGYFLRRYAKKIQDQTGKQIPYVLYILGPLVILPLLIWFIGGSPLTLHLPKLQGFNFTGGISVSPEFLSLLMGLVLYTSAFIAEIVRSGIQSVQKGQEEAAEALGLKSYLVLTLVILPQALRVIIPPLTSQLLNLTKNSSLAVAIAYPDFVNIANTTMNQTGQAIELISLIILVYLTFSLLTSLFMNWFNKKMALVER